MVALFTMEGDLRLDLFGQRQVLSPLQPPGGLVDSTVTGSLVKSRNHMFYCCNMSRLWGTLLDVYIVFKWTHIFGDGINDFEPRNKHLPKNKREQILVCV